MRERGREGEEEREGAQLMSRRKAEQPGKRHLMSWQQEQCATVHNDDDLTMTRKREKEEEKEEIR